VKCDVSDELLAALTAGDLPAEPAGRIERHARRCRRCRARLAAIRAADGALAALPRFAPSPAALLAARRALAGAARGGAEPEIMTLPEVAEFLRIDEAALGEIADELPAFELAGRVRVRRARLLEWIARRESDFAREAAASWAARAMAGAFGKGAA